MKNTDDEPRRLSFKDFTVVDYVPGMGQHTNYQAQKRHRGTVGEDVEQTDEMSNKLLNRYSDAAKKDSKKDRAKGMRKAKNIRTNRANSGLFGSNIGEESSEEFTPHDMFDPDTGEKKRAKTYNMHLALKAKGWGHSATESVEHVDEAYTVAQRIKAKQRMKKMSKRIQMAKKRSMKRAPSTEKLKLRARKQAKGALVSKWMRGQQKADLSFSQRQNIEKRLKSASGRIDTMSKKLLPDVRKQDRERRANAKNKSEEK